MESILFGFIIIALIFLVVDLVYQYRIYRVSLLRHLYRNYLEYYVTLRRSSVFRSTNFLKQEIGYHRLVFGQSAQKDISNYILVISSQGITCILIDGPKQLLAKQSGFELEKKCGKLINDLLHRKSLDYEVNVIVVSNKIKEATRGKHFYKVSEHELVHQLKAIQNESKLSPTEIEWVFNAMTQNTGG